MNQLYYKPSGKIAGIYFLYFALFTFICVPILSAAYIYLIHYIPFIYLNLLIAIGCGLALGYMMMIAAKKGKARNPAAILLFSVIAVIIMKYIQWCMYIPLIYDNVYEVFFPGLTIGERFVWSFYLFIEPGTVFELAKEINEFGAWGIGETEVAGVMLLIVWIVEFLIMAVPTLVVARFVTKVPFSEATGEWYVDMGRKIAMDIPPDFDTIKNRMENGDFTGLVQLARSGRTNYGQFLELKFSQPQQPSQSEPYYLSIERIVLGAKNKRSAKPLVRYMAVGAYVLNEITAVEPH